MSNNGLNSNEALDENTATSCSVMMSGARRVKEMPDRLDMINYSCDSGNSDPRPEAPNEFPNPAADTPKAFTRALPRISTCRFTHLCRSRPLGSIPEQAAALHRFAGKRPPEVQTLLPLINEDFPPLYAFQFQNAVRGPGIVLQFLSHFIFIFGIEN